ncbi:glutathione S-transferase family protein [Granulosicoccus antarcticus]|uniref:Glutathione S-transferase n=1 Tax=Granulosicoccus antarcticus IMCC3135 TaxID=1192854 RepID=A0A2Z2NZN5_9GAMM|nr:glutathione S-transferase family protein [Granulosicoccus antarcticus]ASJ73277.1 Glutathione S-transferase [Granulosicoccus antarcticus IMCC3135]
MNAPHITLYYAPQTRATGTRILLEELGAPYDLHVLDIHADHFADTDFRKINPLRKVPTLKSDNTIITEQVAIALFLGDRFPDAGLAPAFDDPDRGTYLRWMVYYAACFEPALIDKSTGHDPGPASSSVYGTLEEMLSTLEQAMTPGPFILGDRMTVADILWGVALHWTMMFDLVPENPVFRDFAQRIMSRPLAMKVQAMDETLAAEQAAARGQ